MGHFPWSEEHWPIPGVSDSGAQTTFVRTEYAKEKKTFLGFVPDLLLHIICWESPGSVILRSSLGGSDVHLSLETHLDSLTSHESKGKQVRRGYVIFQRHTANW